MVTRTLTGNAIPSDFALASELKKRGWQGGYESRGNANMFRDREGKIIALVFYDNRASLITKVSWL